MNGFRIAILSLMVLVVALPDSTKSAYIGLAGENCILTDIVTGKKQILYMNLMGLTPYRVGKPYILLGFYDRDTGKPMLYYGMRVTSDNLTFAEWYGKNLFNDPTGEFPPCAFQPDKNTPAEEFLAYCIENVGKE